MFYYPVHLCLSVQPFSFGKETDLLSLRKFLHIPHPPVHHVTSPLFPLRESNLACIGIIHYDVKPRNSLHDRRYNTFVVDLGMGRRHVYPLRRKTAAAVKSGNLPSDRRAGEQLRPGGGGGGI